MRKTCYHQHFTRRNNRDRCTAERFGTGLVSDAIIDVWENEPAINLTLLDKVFLGTPHIAGYSADGKANATRMSLDALCRYFNVQADYQIIPPAPSQPRITADTLSAAYLQTYDPDKTAMRSKRIRNYLESYGETIL